MINIIHNNTVQKVTPTIFPDGTSQVWKLEIEPYKNSAVKIVWNFEQEAELIWVNQLTTLLNSAGIVIDELYIPYLPYARQDKFISNNSTFAKTVFLKSLLIDSVAKLSALDAHSKHAEVQSYSAESYIKKAIAEFEPDVLVFPDEGAYERYQNQLSNFSVLVLDKVRNQDTGEITSLILDVKKTTPALIRQKNIKYQKMLIIDDICDGGATFINASIFLHERYDCEIALYVTHGIFSKGYEGLINSGITVFYTTQSLIKNTAGYVLQEVEKENNNVI